MKYVVNALRYQWHTHFCQRDATWLTDGRAWRCAQCRYRRFRLTPA